MKQYLKETIKYLLRSKPFIQKEINEVEKLYKMSDEELYRYKEEKFLKLFRRAITKSKFYKEFYRNAGIGINDIQSLEDIKKLPVLTKEMVRKNYKDILTVPRWKVTKAHTSGTTGTPLTLFQDYKTIKWEQAYIWVRRMNYGFHFGDPLVSMRGNLGHNTFKLFVHVSNTLFLTSYSLNKEKALQYYAEIKKFNPKAIEGYPSSLYNLCILLNEYKLSLNIPLTFTSSETLYDFQRKLIEKTLNTKIYDRYGCTERTVSYAQKIEGVGYYEEPAYSFNEIQENCIYTTSLLNTAFPLIRYEVSDIVNVRTINNTLNILSISGRREDTIICKDGTSVGRIDHIFKNTKNILLAQIIQYEKGIIDLNIVRDFNFSNNDLNSILSKLYSKISKENITVNINFVSKDEIIYSSRNKFNLVVSQIKNQDNDEL